MQQNKRIWILEDDPGSQFVYSEILEIRYEIKLFSTLKSFTAAIGDSSLAPPDLVIADIRLPDDSFLNFINQSSGSLPFRFIVVSSLDDLDALRLCFRHGAVDYITKPFGKSEIIVKVEKIFEAEPTSPGRGEFQVDSKSFTVAKGPLRSAALTVKEFQIITALAEAPERTLDRSMIIGKIWGDINVSQKTLDVHLVNLRRKLSVVGVDICHRPPHDYYLSYGMNP